ncbi:MAG: hypothetical protein JXA21_15320 [Anaerolineae bacterium]|nr:hypothetical protein [Anaerolineae bacterium]
MRHILLYGSSIFLAGLAAELKTLPHLHVHHLTALNKAEDLTTPLDAVVVDLNEECAGKVLALFLTYPDLTLIGVNSRGSAVTVLTGRAYRAHTLADVVACL